MCSDSSVANPESRLMIKWDITPIEDIQHMHHMKTFNDIKHFNEMKAVIRSEVDFKLNAGDIHYFNAKL